MSDLTVLPVTVEHHREPIGIGETTPAAVLGDPHRPARLAAGGLRAGDRAGGRRRVVVRPRRLRRVGARAVGGAAARPAASAGPSGCGSGARAPPSRRPGARTSSSRPGCSSRRTGRPQLVQPVLPEPSTTSRSLLLRREFVLDKPGRPRPALRHRAGRLRGRAQRRRRRRPGAGAGLDQLPAPAALPDLRRDRRCSPRAPTRSASPSPTAGTAATSASPAGRQIYGDRTGAFVQLEVEHPDGSRTDRRPATAPGASTLGPVTRAGIYSGETVRLRAGSCPAGRRPASTTRLDAGRASARSTSRRWSRPTGPPVRRTQVAAGRWRSRTSPSGKTLVDFGQNLVGRLRLRAARRPGRHRDHRCGTPRCSSTASWAPGRCARRRRPTSSSSTGTAPRTWEPRFTFHGFRYAEVTGWPGELTADALEAVVVHTDLRPHRHVHLLGRRREPAARERRLGHARQLRRRPDRLPAARRAAGLDRRPRRCSRRRRRFLYDTAGHAALLAGRPRRRAARGPRRRRADLRAVPADITARLPAAAGGRRLGRRRRRRAVGAVPAHTATPGCSPTSGTA